MGTPLTRSEYGRLPLIPLRQSVCMYTWTGRDCPCHSRRGPSVPSEMVDRAVNHLETTRPTQLIRRNGAHIEHLLLLDTAADSSRIVCNGVCHSFCHVRASILICIFCVYFVYYENCGPKTPCLFSGHPVSIVEKC